MTPAESGAIGAACEVRETVATAKVATSAHEARALGFLRNSDRISMNRERVLSDAKARALELVRAGYEPPVPRALAPYFRT